MNVLITGDSHASSLREGQQLLNGAQLSGGTEILIKPLGNAIHLRTPFFLDRGEFAEITEPSYRNRLNRVPPANKKYDFIGITAPLHPMMVWRSDWSLFCPWNLAQENGKASLVSSNLLNNIIEDDLRYILSLLDVISRTTRVFVIDNPGPFRTHMAISINGEEKVMHIHKTYREYAMRELTKRNIPVIAIDPTWLDSRGFMEPRFKIDEENDHWHGNAEFGRLMMEKILNFLESQPNGCKLI